MQFKNWKDFLWPLGGTLLGLLVMPLAIAQYPRFFNENEWTLPASVFMVLICWIIPLLVHDRARKIYSRIIAIPTCGGILFFFAVLAVLAVLIFGSSTLFRFHSRHLKGLIAQNPLPTSDNASSLHTEQALSHTLLVRYSEYRLPIRVAPKDTAYILQLNPNIERWVLELSNSKKAAVNWPSDVNPTKTIDYIYACELTNEEDKTLLDVSVSFDVSFHELEMFPPIPVTDNKNGTKSAALPRPGLDHIVIAFPNPKESKVIMAARDGALVKEFIHSASIPSIQPKSTARIYLVNQSSLISKFKIPTQATGIVAGNAQRITIVLVRPDVTVLDTSPWYGLGPSQYHWTGVPGAP
jgi:hypothetical protein